MNNKQFSLLGRLMGQKPDATNNPAEPEAAKPQAASKPSGASPQAATKPFRKVVEVEDRSWKARANQVAWEGIKNLTGTQNDPKKQIMLAEMQASRDKALRVGARCVSTPQP